MDIGSEDAVGFRTHCFEYLALSNIFKRGRKRSPEIFADAAVFFARECLERQLEFARRFVVLILVPINQRQAIMHVGAFRIQLQGISEIHQSARGLADSR